MRIYRLGKKHEISIILHWLVVRSSLWCFWSKACLKKRKPSVILQLDLVCLIIIYRFMLYPDQNAPLFPISFDFFANKKQWLWRQVSKHLQKRSVYSQFSVPLQTFLLTVIISGSRPLVVAKCMSKCKRYIVSFWAAFRGTELHAVYYLREKVIKSGDFEFT